MKKPSTRLVIAVSSDKSDIFFANEIAARFSVAGIVLEYQYANRRPNSGLQKLKKYAGSPKLLWSRSVEAVVHAFDTAFAPFNRKQNQPDFDGNDRSLAESIKCPVLSLYGTSEINSEKAIRWLRDLTPDLIVVCGTSLLSREFLDVPSIGTLNLHGGLVQQYRGLFTTEWAIFNRQPEYIGATVHFVSDGVDDGQIVYQGRPVIEGHENPNDLYAKVVKLGVKMMAQAITDSESGTLSCTKTPALGKIYTRAMFDRASHWKSWNRCNSAISEYLKEKEHRDDDVRASLINPFNGN